MNCTITVEQQEGNYLRQNKYTFDDYRVARAVSNLLDNINNVKVKHTLFDVNKNIKK